MKLILRVLFFFAISAKLFSQNTASADKVVYLDSTWTETSSDNYMYVRLIKDYSINKKTYLVKDYYKSKKIQMIGESTDKDIIKEEGPYVYYYENGNKKLAVSYSNRKKNGKEYNWYENGKLKSGPSIDSLNIGHHYKVVFQKAVPKSSMESFYKYISQNLDTSENRFLGKMYIYFVIDKEGNLVEPKILKGLGYDLNTKVIATITNFGKWIPGVIRGIPTRVSYTIPITIAKNNQ